MIRQLSCVFGVVLGASACGGGQTSESTLPGASEDVRFADEPSATESEGSAPPATKWVKQGEQKLAAGEREAAKELFERALAEDPNDARAHFNLGLVHEWQGERQRAEKHYRRAVEIRSGFAEALSNLGSVLRAQGEHDEAVQVLQAATEAQPELAPAWINLALTREEQGDLQAAEQAYRKALQLDPDRVLPRVNLGLLLVKRGRKDQAADQLLQAKSRAGDDAAALAGIGNGLRLAGRTEAAVEVMQSAIEAREEGPTPALLSELALAQLAAGDREAAIGSLRKAIALKGDYATAHFLLANMWASNGDLEKARKHFQRYLDLAPEGPHAEKAMQRLEMLKK